MCVGGQMQCEFIYNLKVFFLILHGTKRISNIHVSNRDLTMTTAGHNLVRFKITIWERTKYA